MLDAPQENCCCFHYINMYVNVLGYKHCYMFNAE